MKFSKSRRSIRMFSLRRDGRNAINNAVNFRHLQRKLLLSASRNFALLPCCTPLKCRDTAQRFSAFLHFIMIIILLFSLFRVFPFFDNGLWCSLLSLPPNPPICLPMLFSLFSELFSSTLTALCVIGRNQRGVFSL